MIRYLAVFGDLATYSPSLIFSFSNLEIALACLICARKRYKVYPNNSQYIFKLYAQGEEIWEKTEDAAEKLWEMFESINSKWKPSTIIGQQI